MADLSEFRKSMECPICLDVIRNVGKVKACSHIFYNTNHNCPICRIHCPSRRSLEADEKLDAVISRLFPNNNQHEEEAQVTSKQLVRSETVREPETRHIPRTVMRRVRKHESSADEDKDASSNLREVRRERGVVYRQVPMRGMVRVQKHESSADHEDNDTSPNHPATEVRIIGSYQPPSETQINVQTNVSDDRGAEVIPIRRRRRARSVGLSQLYDTLNQTYEFSSEEEESDSSSGDEYIPQIRKKRARRGVRSSQPLRNIHQTSDLSSKDKGKALCSASHDNDSDENDSEESKEELIGTKPLVLQWGGSDMRTSIRQTKTKNRIERLVGYLQNLKRNQEEMDVQVFLVSMDEQKIPNLEIPQLSCKPNLTMKSLCQQYIAPYIKAQAEEIELYVVKELVSELKPIDPSSDKVQSVSKEHNVGGLRMYNFNNGFVLLGYRKTASGEEE